MPTAAGGSWRTFVRLGAFAPAQVTYLMIGYSVVKELREAFRASLRTCCGLFREIVSRKPKEFFITAPGK